LSKKTIFLSILIISTIGCASLARQEERERMATYLNSQLNTLTYDQALSNWGEPLSTTQGDTLFIVTWGSEKTGYATIPIGNILYTGKVSHGWNLQITFDKSSRQMTSWKFTNW